MAIKLVLLKSGEKLITDIKEGFIEDNLVCYLMEKPCTVSVNGTYKILDEDDGEEKVSISLHAWPSLSDQTTIEINPDWIITTVEPKSQLKKLYKNQVLGINEDETSQSIVFTEQSDSDISD